MLAFNFVIFTSELPTLNRTLHSLFTNLIECGKTLFLRDNLDVITLVTLSFCTYRVYSYGNVNPLTHHGLLFTHPIQT
jgi:hypothetical protein